MGGIGGKNQVAKRLISDWNRPMDALYTEVTKRIETYGKVKKQEKVGES